MSPDVPVSLTTESGRPGPLLTTETDLSLRSAPLSCAAPPPRESSEMPSGGAISEMRPGPFASPPMRRMRPRPALLTQLTVGSETSELAAKSPYSPRRATRRLGVVCYRLCRPWCCPFPPTQDTGTNRVHCVTRNDLHQILMPNIYEVPTVTDVYNCILSYYILTRHRARVEPR